MDDQERVAEDFRKRLPKYGPVKKAIIKALRRAKIANGILLCRTTEPLPRHELGAFYSELGTIHGVVATARPENVDVVVIEDTAGSGQRITVPLQLIIDYSEGKIKRADYIRSWKVEGGRRGE